MYKRILSMVLLVFLIMTTVLTPTYAIDIFGEVSKNVEAHKGSEVWYFTANDKYLFAHARDGGIELFDLSNPESPALVDPQPEIYKSIKGYVDVRRPIIIKDKYLYAGQYMGSANEYQLVKIDITDPLEPGKPIGVKSPKTFDIKIKDNYAYVALAGNGIAIYDITGGKLEQKNVIKDLESRMIQVDGNYIYSGSLTVLDIIKLKDPVTLESKSSLNLNDKSVKLFDICKNTDYIYLASFDEADIVKNKVIIVDVSEPAKIASAKMYVHLPNLASFEPYRITIEGNILYMGGRHQSMLELVDITKPDMPQYIKSVGVLSIPYDIQSIGKYLYTANRGSGLSVVESVELKATTPTSSPTAQNNTNELPKNGVTTKTFDDIKDHWAKADIEQMASNGIIKGIDATNFAPDESITRAEFLTLITRTIKLNSVQYSNVFNDVTEDQWYANTVQAAFNNGLIDKGMVVEGNFAPTAQITREEMTSLIISAYNYIMEQKASAGSVENYQDKDLISSWAMEYVKAANELGIIKGLSATQFAPKDSATRAQSAVIIKRLWDKILGKLNKDVSLQPEKSTATSDLLQSVVTIWDKPPVPLRVSEAVAPGRLLSLNGTGIYAEDIKVAAKLTNGNAEMVPPEDAITLEIVQTDEKGYFVVARLPEGSTSGVYDLWIKNKYGWSKPIQMNNATPLFMSEYEVFEGLNIKLVGRNFDLKEFGGAATETKVQLNNDKGDTYPVNIEDLNPFAVTFKVSGVPLGKYQVEIKNQDRDKWRRLNNGQTLTVVEAGPDPLGLGVVWAKDYKWDKRYNVIENGAIPNDEIDDTAAIQATVDKAKQDGGGIVYIPNGIYYVKAIALPADIVILGEDKYKTELLYSGEKNDFITLKDDGKPLGRVGVARVSLKATSPVLQPDTFLALNPGWGDEVKDYVKRTTSRVFVYEVNIDASLMLDAPLTEEEYKKLPRAIAMIGIGKERFLVSNNSFKGLSGSLQYSYINEYVTMNNNTMDYRVGHVGSSAQYSFYENNKITGYPDIGVINLHGFTVASDTYVYNNEMKNIGVNPTKNWGEVIMAEIPGKFFNFGKVVSATDTQIEVDAYSKPLIIPNGDPKTVKASEQRRHAGHSVLIMEGRGIGQVRLVKNLDGNVITIDKPWDVVPDQSSKFTLIVPNNNVTIYRNTGSHCSGPIMFYGNGINCVAAENNLKETDGIYTVSFNVPNLKRLNPAYFIRLDRNIVDDTSAHLDGDPSLFGTDVAEATGYCTQTFGIDMRDNIIRSNKNANAVGLEVRDNGVGVKAGNTRNVTIENNKLENLKSAISVQSGAYGTVISSNEFVNCLEKINISKDNQKAKVID